MKLRLIVLFASFVLGALVPLPRAKATNLVRAKKNPSRIVAVGDVHGDLDGLTQILRRAGLVDLNNHWTGGDTTLVLTGDMLDRGAYDRQVLDLIMELEKQASKANGSVEAILGNHEMMNMTGDLRYVAPESYLSFSDPKSEKRREEALKDYVKYLKQRARFLKEKPTEFSLQDQEQWMKAHPLGYFEHREAFGPRGKYGRWLRKRPAIVQMSGIVFLHGGLNQKLRINAKQLNGIIESEISAFDQFKAYFTSTGLILPFFDLSETSSAVVAEVNHFYRQLDRTGKLTERQRVHLQTCQKFLRFVNWMIFQPDGPLWFRGFADWTEEEGRRYLKALSSVFQAQHFVVGHTAQLPREIKSRFGGQVFLIDTGMLQNYYEGGGPSALEIANGTFRALYLDGETLLLDPDLAAVAAR